MNQTIELLLNRHSVRAYEEKDISPEDREQIIAATLRAATAGNMMLYSIIEISDQQIKDTLAITCDNQPFIAKAPLVLIFLADYQRWYDYFKVSGVEELCEKKGGSMRRRWCSMPAQLPGSSATTPSTPTRTARTIC